MASAIPSMQELCPSLVCLGIVPLLRYSSLPLYFEEGRVKFGLGSSLWFMCTGVKESSCTSWMDLALPHREESTEPQLPPYVAATILALNRQELSAAVRPPPGEPSRGFLSYEGATTWRG